MDMGGDHNTLRDLGINLSFSLAGFFGSLFGVRKLRRVEALIAVATGTAAANYLTPVVLYLCKLPDRVELGTAFMVGTLGLRATEYAISKILHEPPKK